MIDPGAPSIPTSMINPSQRSSFKTLSQKHCERSKGSVRGLQRITRWPPYTSTPHPSVGLPYTTLLDPTPDGWLAELRLAQHTGSESPYRGGF